MNSLDYFLSQIAGTSYSYAFTSKCLHTETSISYVLLSFKYLIYYVNKK